jgi:NitT/TauT family transport system permease protein
MQSAISATRGDTGPGSPGDAEVPEGAGQVPYGAIGVTVFVVVWETVCRSGAVSPIFLSAPTAILRAAGEMAASGELGEHLRTSGAEFTLGFLLAAATGVPLGLLAGWYWRLQALLDPFLTAFYATPRIALLPLIILWVGLGLVSKVLVVFLGAFFPICLSTIAGARTVDPRHVRIARAFRASEIRLFRTILLPSCVPFILAGLRLGVGRALVGVVVAELYAGTAGIGYLIAVAGATFRTERVFVGVLVLMAFGLLANAALARLEARVERWRPPAAKA